MFIVKAITVFNLKLRKIIASSTKVNNLFILLKNSLLHAITTNCLHFSKLEKIKFY